jgi:leucyl aminopeptidase (aminopeptidase T)
MEEIIEIIEKKCVRIKEKDSILIITDKNKQKIANKFLNYFKNKNFNVSLVKTDLQKIDGEEPCREIFYEMQKNNIIFLLTTCSMTHTKATKTAMEKGAKVISMPNITFEALKFVKTNYENMEKLTTKIRSLLNKGKNVQIITDKGTNLILDISGMKGFSLYGICKKGNFINLPDGEAMICPKTANGVLVIDGSMPPDSELDLGKIGKIKNPIKFKIKQGKVFKISGKKEAKILKNVFDKYGESSKVIAELGIGTNNSIKKITGNVTIDEKAYGTIHIAFGDSSCIGGKNVSQVHLDGVIQKPCVWIDHKLIINKGKISDNL